MSDRYYCQQGDRREAVRAMEGSFGLDFVELSDDPSVLVAYFLGALPAELRADKPGTERHLRLDGGERIKEIRISDVDPVVDPDQDVDDYLVVTLDGVGDFSTYTLRLVDVEGADPAFAAAEFVFHVDCPRDVDCLPACSCERASPAAPGLNYLARDYAAFRQLVLDRFALLVPDWRERHVPDAGIALVEILAYAGDYLSYYQDAVATEAYLDTARQRISVRRHARLVDYAMHEGCNARAWVCAELVGGDVTLDVAAISFVTGLNDSLAARQTVLEWPDLADVSPASYEVFEPLVADPSVPIVLRAAHSEIHFYTWGDRECCLERGSTTATLRDAWASAPGPSDARSKPRRALSLAPGDVLIFEEVLGPKTAVAADASPGHRHAVRLTAVTATKDVVVTDEHGRPTPVVTIEWAAADALPFPICISVIGPPPECRYVEDVSVARGNVLLVDHGRTVGPTRVGPVPTLHTVAACECVDHPSDVEILPGRFRPTLAGVPLTFSQPLAQAGPPPSSWPQATAQLHQDVRATRPAVTLDSDGGRWEPRFDLLESHPSDRHFCVELDNDGIGQLRFGNGELGAVPPGGTVFQAVYRLGNGTSGNVGAEAISRIVLRGTGLSGVSVAVRNPLAAAGGVNPEPVAEAKLFAPRGFRKQIERAIVAHDYEILAERDPAVQRASARLEWTGSWYEADVAVDPLGTEEPEADLIESVDGQLQGYRRIGHDLKVRAADYVPLDIRLEACVLPHYQRAHVKAALLDLFGNAVLPGGGTGFFHPDKLSFGQAIYVSRIVAAGQRVVGISCLEVTRLQRMSEAANHELRDGELPLRSWEVAQLDNDPNHPDRGRLEINVIGGR